MKINKKLLFSLPLLIIGISMVILGARWLFVDEPWMLDKVANEERLGISFKELFDANNQTLPDYLKQIYRFFGLWVIIIGGFITCFSTPQLSNNSAIRLRLLFCVGIMILFGTILAYLWIPSSPFIYLSWILFFLYSISFYAYIINKKK